MSASIFSKMIRGEHPCFKVYEDEHTFAFLTRDAIRHGHTLIVPKIEVDYFIDVPEPYYSAIFKTAKTLARAIHNVTGCKRVGTVIAGWDIPHFHYHLVPMFEYHDLDPRRAKQFSNEENLTMQKKICDELVRLKSQ
ncbi:MAG: HIT family protein [Oligoflexales bacterium]